MPRFFFTIHDGATERIDRTGTELKDRRLVRGEAIRAAGEMLADIDGTLQGEEWRMTVTDVDGRVVLRLRFSATEES